MGFSGPDRYRASRTGKSFIVDIGFYFNGAGADSFCSRTDPTTIPSSLENQSSKLLEYLAPNKGTGTSPQMGNFH
jgi:hypothetical protein